MNSKLRTNAKSEFENNLFKLMNNSIFGKTMKNVRNHRDTKLVNSDKRRKRLVSKPNYHSHKKCSGHLMAIEMKKIGVKLTKPLYLGMSILDVRFKSYYHVMYTEEVNKIALSSNDDKRLQTSDRITTYPYGTNAFKVCESEMLSKIRV